MPPAAVCQPSTALIYGTMLQTGLSQFSLTGVFEQPRVSVGELNVASKVGHTTAPSARPACALSWRAALEQLSHASICQGGELVGRLRGLLSALGQDSEDLWRENGVVGACTRALKYAEAGQEHAARQVLQGLLSLSLILERRWSAFHRGTTSSTQSSGDPCSSSVSSGAFRQPVQEAAADPSSSCCSSSCSDGDSAPPALFAASPQQLQQQDWASHKRPFAGGAGSGGIAVVPDSKPAAPLHTGSLLGPPPKRLRQSAAPAQPALARPQLLPGVSLPSSSSTKEQQQAANGQARSKDLLRSIEAALHIGNAEAVAAPEAELFGAVSCSSGEDEEASAGPGATATWQGSLKHKLGSTVVELCTMSVVLPKGFVEQFPAAVYASELLHRRQVSLGKHAVCRCTLGSLSARQLQGLATLAQCQLVAIVRLQHCALHLVPYFDNAQCMRMVGFLKAVPA